MQLNRRGFLGALAAVGATVGVSGAAPVVYRQTGLPTGVALSLLNQRRAQVEAIERMCNPPVCLPGPIVYTPGEASTPTGEILLVSWGEHSTSVFIPRADD